MEVFFAFDFDFDHILKASFNNVKSEMHGPTCYQCMWYDVTLKP